MAIYTQNQSHLATSSNRTHAHTCTIILFSRTGKNGGYPADLTIPEFGTMQVILLASSDSMLVENVLA